jgi:hypothetical protein
MTGPIRNHQSPIAWIEAALTSPHLYRSREWES